MTGFLLQIAATKLALSIALGAMVWLVQRCAARPAIVHTLWLLVLGSLLVPAVVPMRVLPEWAAVEAVVAPVEGAGAAHYTGMSRHEMGPQRWLRGNGESLVVLAWYPEEFMRGPGPLAMAADPTTSCHLDAAAWNEGDRPAWDCIIIDPDDAVLFTEVPVTSVSASDSSRLTSLLNRDRRRLHEALRFSLGRSSGYVLLAGRGHRPARPR